MRRLTLADADLLRSRRGMAVLLYLTDRCPVGCDHCSVSALPRGARVDDGELLDRLITQLCQRPRLRLVGVSGGEPFIERRALDSATGRLAAAGKQLVLYTSGNWGRDDGTAPGWTAAVLSRASCVVLSTDAYHAARLPERRYLAAVQAAAEAGSWIAVQVLDSAGQVATAERLLATALGPGWPELAEIRRTPLLARGRATARAAPRKALSGRSFGTCSLAAAPVVRYDGRLTACCNEDVITGHGPAALRPSGRDPGALHAGLDALESEPFLRVASDVGLGELTRLPAYHDLGAQGHSDICSLCWSLLEAGANRDPAVRAVDLAT